MLQTFAGEITTDNILSHDVVTTHIQLPEATFRAASAWDVAELVTLDLDPEAQWIVEIEGMIAAAGGVLLHYNPPYGDIYMKVAEPMRRRGVGSFLVQELKRICHKARNIPAARCNAVNAASRKTLAKAGFARRGLILSASIRV
jgi:GNAT superfamily N-acetyltransferase